MWHRATTLFFGLISVGACSMLAACNAVTGVSDLRLEGDEVPRDPMVPAGGVSITEIDLYQGTKRELMNGGMPASSTVAIVAGRPALMRLFIGYDNDYNHLPVTARLYINNAEEPIVVAKTIEVLPSEGTLDSTLNIPIPGELIAPGMTYRVELKQDPGAIEATGLVRYPAEGDEALEVKSDGMTLKLVIVPIQYGADGSNRLPDTSPEQLKAYEDTFMGSYPIPKVEVSVREQPMQWTGVISPNGAGFGEILDALVTQRNKDNVADDVYYYGAFSPSASEGGFCGGGCVAGLSYIGSAGSAQLRAAVGLGYKGSISTDTAQHEIGHTFGRDHSPGCGADKPDPNYPYSGGDIGVYGYDIVKGKLFTPKAADFMSYCAPYWVSDYTFMKLFDRFAIVNKAMRVVHPPELVDRVYARVAVQPDGSLAWRPSLKLHAPPEGHETRAVTVMTANGPEIVTGQYFPYDHIEGGLLMLPEPSSPLKSIRLDYKGKLRSLSR